MAKAVIFDYGVGNLLSLKCALNRVGFNVAIGTSGQDLMDTDVIVLPGVGNFMSAVKKLDCVREVIKNKVAEGVSLLGICLGLQLFFEASAEGSGDGLSFFKGNVIRLHGDLKIPHIGWNTVNLTKSCELFDGVADNAYVYFVHSFHSIPTDESVVCAKTTYGTTFVSAVADKNMYGFQFHPEKSGDIGLQILRNFAIMVTR